MELTHIRYFLEVARTEHVTQSAKTLCIVQPALTHALHKLEDEIGVKLFRTQGRNIKLTEAGEYFYRKAKPLYDDIDALPAQLRALLERLIFPWLSYNDYSLTAPKQMPVILTYTMNANQQQAQMVYQSMAIIENCLERAMGDVEHVDAHNTYQVLNYDRYELAGFPEPMKRQYRDEHWENDLQRAYDAGRRMAQKIIAS